MYESRLGAALALVVAEEPREAFPLRRWLRLVSGTLGLRLRFRSYEAW